MLYEDLRREKTNVADVVVIIEVIWGFEERENQFWTINLVDIYCGRWPLNQMRRRGQHSKGPPDSYHQKHAKSSS